MSERTVTFELSGDEALVLFDFLSRYEETDQLQITDPADQQVLWKVEATLDKALVAPFRSNYDELVAAARARIRDRR